MLRAVRILFKALDRYKAALEAQGTTLEEEHERLRSQGLLLSQNRQNEDRTLTDEEKEWGRRFLEAIDQVARERAEQKILGTKNTAQVDTDRV